MYRSFSEPAKVGSASDIFRYLNLPNFSSIRKDLLMISVASFLSLNADGNLYPRRLRAKRTRDDTTMPVSESFIRSYLLNAADYRIEFVRKTFVTFFAPDDPRFLYLVERSAAISAPRHFFHSYSVVFFVTLAAQTENGRFSSRISRYLYDGFVSLTYITYHNKPFCRKTVCRYGASDTYFFVRLYSIIKIEENK